MKYIGATLILLGCLGVFFGGFRVGWPDRIIDAGSVQVSVTRHKTLPVPPILGGLALVAGSVS